MKCLFYLSTLVLAVSCGCGGTKGTTDPSELPLPKGAEVTQYEGMTLVWHDEFDVDGAPSSAWSYEEGFVRNEEDQWYQKENAFVQDGTLILEARRETRVNPNYQSGNSSWKTSRPAAEYTSACVTTRESFSFRYGRLEVRAKIPVDLGSWPAIWSLGNQGWWPSNGEIDLMEFYPRNGVPGILANACWTSATGGAEWDDTHVPLTHFTDKDPDWVSKFHLWRMDWDPQWIRLYLDDELLNEIDLSKTVNASGPWMGQNPFSNDVEGFGDYILLDLAIGGLNGGDPSRTAFPLRYYVDYVRVYQATRLPLPEHVVRETTGKAILYRDTTRMVSAPAYLASADEFLQEPVRMERLLKNGFCIAVPAAGADVSGATASLLERADIDPSGMVLSRKSSLQEEFDYAAVVVWDAADLADTTNIRPSCPHLFMNGGALSGYFLEKGGPGAVFSGDTAVDSPETLIDLLERIALQKQPIQVVATRESRGPAPGKIRRPRSSGPVIKETFGFAVKDSDTLYLDVYRQAACDGLRPVILYSFGGGWQGGKRSDMDSPLYPFCRPMAQLGYVVVAADYRRGYKKAEDRGEARKGNMANWLLTLTGKDYDDLVDLCRRSCLMAVEDLYDATSYVVAHAREWGGNPEQIVLSGGSAGACNSLMAEYLRANKAQVAKAHLPKGFRYAGIVPCAGAIFTPDEAPITWKTAPAPILFLHGTEDPLIPYGNGRGMKGPEAIIASLPESTPYVLYSFIGMNHDASSIPTAYMNHVLSAFVEQYVLDGDPSRIHVEETLLDPSLPLFQRYLQKGNPYSLEEIMQAAEVIWASYED